MVANNYRTPAHDASILLCARRASEITILSYCVLKDITFAITVIINVTEYDAATLVVTQTNAIWYPYIGPHLTVPRTDPQCSNKMKSQKYNTVGNLPKLNRKIVERWKIDPLTHKYITTHFHGLAQALQ